ncbi:TPA: restriction endonuclease subunit S [Photobacterium damselae]
MSIQQHVTPEGYKQTEVGLLPVDWDVVKIGSFAEVIRGASPRPKGDKRYYGGNVPRLMVQDVTRDGKFVIPQIDFLTEAGAKLSRPCKAGTLTIVCSGTVGVPSILAVDACIHDGFLGLVKLKKNVVRDYLYHFFNTQLETFDNSATHGGVFTNLTSDGVREFLVPLPPSRSEQTAIANALSDVDALLTELEKLIAKKQAIKTATMQQLLTGKTRLPQFATYTEGEKQGQLKGTKFSELGEIPEDWEVVKLDFLADVIDPHPSHRAPPELSSGLPFLGIGDFDKHGNVVKDSFRTVGQYVYEEHRARYKLEDGLLGLGRVASIGKVVRLKSDIGHYTVSPTLGVLKPLKVDLDYLFYFLESDLTKNQFSKIMSGSTRSSVGMIVLRELKILSLPDEEAKYIGKILLDMDSEIQTLEQRLAKTRQIKQGMMQELLTGRTRLPFKKES